MDERFRDPAIAVDAFTTPVMVRCPRCGGRARVDHDADAAEARVTCPSCGYARVSAASVRSLGGPVDPWLGLDLWLQIPCCGETFWARNRAHLDFLAAHLAARLRERPAEAPAGAVRNRLMASRLPRWMTSAGNRESVLRCIEALRERAGAGDAGSREEPAD